MKRTLVWICVAVVFCSGTVVLAEESPGAPQPTAEHKALEMWIGNWTGGGEMMPGPFGPGGKMSWTEACDWFEGGRFHVICTSSGHSPMGPMRGLGIIGYNAGKKVYTHYGVDNTGWAGYSEGRVEGDTWTFRSEETVAGATMLTRFVMTMTSPSSMRFSWEMSDDGKEWQVLMAGTSERK